MKKKRKNAIIIYSKTSNKIMEIFLHNCWNFWVMLWNFLLSIFGNIFRDWCWVFLLVVGVLCQVIPLHGVYQGNGVTWRNFLNNMQQPSAKFWFQKPLILNSILTEGLIVIYEVLCFDVAQGWGPHKWVWVLFNGISTSVGHLMPRKVRLVLSSTRVLGHGFFFR